MKRSYEFTSEQLAKHDCRTWKEGEWIIMQCPTCKFIRRMNWKTGKMHVDHPGDVKALHAAFHEPQASRLPAVSPN